MMRLGLPRIKKNFWIIDDTIIEEGYFGLFNDNLDSIDKKFEDVIWKIKKFELMVGKRAVQSTFAWWFHGPSRPIVRSNVSSGNFGRNSWNLQKKLTENFLSYWDVFTRIPWFSVFPIYIWAFSGFIIEKMFEIKYSYRKKKH